MVLGPKTPVRDAAHRPTDTLAHTPVAGLPVGHVLPAAQPRPAAS